MITNIRLHVLMVAKKVRKICFIYANHDKYCNSQLPLTL